MRKDQKNRNKEYNKKLYDNLTQAQLNTIKESIGKLTREQTAQKLGFSRSKLTRVCVHAGIKFGNVKSPIQQKYKDEDIEKVLNYFKDHTLPETVDYFKKNDPSINPKSIIHRKKYKKRSEPKNTRRIEWKQNEIVESLKLAGLGSAKAITRYLRREREGGKLVRPLNYLFNRKLGLRKNIVNGICHYKVKYFLKKEVPIVKVEIVSSFYNSRKIVLWCDVVKHLEPSCPKAIREAFEALKMFQCWVWQSKNPRKKIIETITKLKLIEEEIKKESKNEVSFTEC